MKPATWHLVRRDDRDWILERGGEIVVRFDHPDDAIRDVAFRAQGLEAASLVIHAADGSVEREVRFGAHARHGKRG